VIHKTAKQCIRQSFEVLANIAVYDSQVLHRRRKWVSRLSSRLPMLIVSLCWFDDKNHDHALLH